MSIKIVGSVLACFFVIMSGTFACTPSSGGVSVMDDMTASEVINYSMETNYNTEKFFMDMTIKIEQDEFFTMSSQGAMDYTNEKMYMLSEYSIDMFGAPMTEKMDIYIIGDWVYTGVTGDYGKDWCKEELDEGEMWEEYDVTGEYMDLVEQFSDAKFLGTEIVLGIDCYKIDVKFDSYVLSSWAAEQADIDSMDDFSVTLWIAKDTYYLVQLEIDMTTTIEGISGSIYMLMTSYGFNEQVYISLPKDAADAPDCYDFDDLGW